MMKTLNRHPYANARIFTNDDGSATLYSYTTPVCELTADGWLYVNGLYSMTTRKHISAWMGELGLTYQLAKLLYESSKSYNIHTGELADI